MDAEYRPRAASAVCVSPRPMRSLASLAPSWAGLGPSGLDGATLDDATPTRPAWASDWRAGCEFEAPCSAIIAQPLPPDAAKPAIARCWAHLSTLFRRLYTAESIWLRIARPAAREKMIHLTYSLTARAAAGIMDLTVRCGQSAVVVDRWGDLLFHTSYFHRSTHSARVAHPIPLLHSTPTDSELRRRPAGSGIAEHTGGSWP